MSIVGQAEAQVSPAVDEWRERALCAEVDPELWFPESGEPNLAAKLICGRCEVRASAWRSRWSGTSSTACGAGCRRGSDGGCAAGSGMASRPWSSLRVRPRDGRGA